MNKALEVIADEKPDTLKSETESQPVLMAPPITFMDVLKDPQAIKAIESLVSTFVTRQGKNTLWDRGFISFCFVSLITCVGILSFYGKFDQSAGVILGAMAGYLFGKRDE